MHTGFNALNVKSVLKKFSYGEDHKRKNQAIKKWNSCTAQRSYEEWLKSKQTIKTK